MFQAETSKEETMFIVNGWLFGERVANRIYVQTNSDLDSRCSKNTVVAERYEISTISYRTKGCFKLAIKSDVPLFTQGVFKSREGCQMQIKCFLLGVEKFNEMKQISES